jgi:hypothetical protein
VGGTTDEVQVRLATSKQMRGISCLRTSTYANLTITACRLNQSWGIITTTVATGYQDNAECFLDHELFVTLVAHNDELKLKARVLQTAVLFSLGRHVECQKAGSWHYLKQYYTPAGG